ncbi:MAG TPA: hypothetical protein VIA63_03360 [Candidatus Limnocylindria bacterium]|jgi:hypothetical protein
MSLDIAVKHALRRVGAVALASGVTGLALLGVGRFILVGDLGIAFPQPPTPAPTLRPTPVPTRQAAVLSDISTPVPVPPATVEPTRTPEPTPAPLELAPFRYVGRSYVGLVVPDTGRTFLAPFAGIVELRVYQVINGEIRIGTSVATLPFYPYVSVIGADRKITYRPAMLGVTELLVRDGQRVDAGAELFRLVAEGRSSWSALYAPTAPYQVVVSLQAWPSGRDMDASVYFSGG